MRFAPTPLVQVELDDDFGFEGNWFSILGYGMIDGFQDGVFGGVYQERMATYEVEALDFAVFADAD
jgi:hypothetical protein